MSRDPKWLRMWWPIWLAIVGLGFGVPETVAIVHDGKGGTLSELTREWLGVDGGGVSIGWSAFTVVLVLFVVWFPVHLRMGWPWEKKQEDS